MSLSQKHAGLILVPWFNSDEWRYVYKSVYSNDKNEQVKGLELLKIWKLRTPILSSGVEGTLILLEALLSDIESLPAEQISSLYSIALMRFLNLSAANSDKQGSITEVSAKNDLPKWLVNLRHDIAHGHHIPSLANLKMALDYGFQWLKGKYWEPQSKIIKDYISEEASENNLSHYMEVYVKLTVGIFTKKSLKSEYLETVKNTIYKRVKQHISTPQIMQDVLLEVISQSLAKDRRKANLGLKILVSPVGLLRPSFECSSENNNENICKNFRNIWQNLLDIYHQYGLLFLIIEELYRVVTDISYGEHSSKMAALWIKEIYTSLEVLRSSADLDALNLQKNQYNYEKESLDFQKDVLHSHNKYLPYFIESLTKYNDISSNEIGDIMNLVETWSNSLPSSTLEEKIYTLEDLKTEKLLDQVDSQNTHLEATSYQHNIRVSNKSKWTRIEDTSIFKNCPMGVLPHQIGRKHPFLALGLS